MGLAEDGPGLLGLEMRSWTWHGRCRAGGRRAGREGNGWRRKLRLLGGGSAGVLGCDSRGKTGSCCLQRTDTNVHELMLLLLLPAHRSQEFRKGFAIGGKLIRPAMVKVGGGASGGGSADGWGVAAPSRDHG